VGTVTDEVQDLNAEANLTFDGSTLTVAGNLTVTGTTTSASTTNTVIKDQLIELGNGNTGSASGDAGIIVERGDDSNAGLVWDESADKWVVCTTSATGASTGDLTLTDAALQAASLDVGGAVGAGTIAIDNNVVDTNAGTFTALTVDFDKTGASSSNNTMIGLNLDMDNTTATGGTNSMTGALITPTLTHANASGTTLVKGLEVTATGSGPGNTTTRALDLTATGADFNQGIFMKVDDGGPDIKMLSSADNADFCTVSTGANGEMTVSTTDGGGAAGHINLEPDGDVVIKGTTPKLIIGDAGAEDTMLVFDGNAQDYRMGIDDGTDTLEIGLGAAHGTTPVIKIDSATNCQIMHNSAVADGQFSGDLVVFQAGEDLTAGEVVYFKSDGKCWKAVATAAATSRCVAMATATISANAMGVFLLKGFARFNSEFPTWTVGGVIYTPEAETQSKNVPEQAAPDTDGDFVQIVGYAISADAVYFCPDSTVIEVA
jgi:hypothetical protein